LVPTVLTVMGFPKQMIADAHGPSLFEEPAPGSAGFTSGDIFGLFRPEVRWHELDLGKSYLEPEVARLAGRHRNAVIWRGN
jgi:hypothetical protein